jgi:3-dehydroquinate synthase
MTSKPNIFLTGFSGSGKTTVGKEVARRLGWRFVGIDDEIVEAQGKPIEAIFNELGEAGFRQIEREHLASACEGERQVVSTGGGIVMDENNVQMMERSGVIVYLDANPEVIHARLETERARGDNPAVRPMIAASDQLSRIRDLKARRQPSYSQAHWTVHTDSLTPGQAAEEVTRAFGLLNQPGDDGRPQETDLAAVVHTSSVDYPVWVGWGILDGLGERVKRILEPPAAYVIGDDGAFTHARQAQASMEAAGIPTHMLLVPPGEPSKTHETAQRAYAWLADRKAERGQMVLAVGGGMVGDLAGFVAATYLRGMPLAQVPTSLLAMMDASVGGKVAVDLPQGKNLVGAFYQPRFVLADVQTLQTMPPRELTSGWAEAIKHGLILDIDLLDAFERDSGPIQALELDLATDIIRRSVAIKAGIVSRDEKETLGVRVLLNYGHTIGHALEKVTAYGRLLHGEAVSVGMMGAAYISQAMGLLSKEEVARQASLLEKYGLPVSIDGVDVDAVADAMMSDKKVAGGTVRWVLLNGLGNAVTRNDVPTELVREALRMVAAPMPANG